MLNEKNIAIYQSKHGAIELRKDADKQTIWATQAQIADIFAAERSVVPKHIRNILNDKELDQSSVCAKFAHTSTDGKSYNVQFYNLDVVLAVGYRTNSRKAIEFRKWATKTLCEYVVNGFIFNKQKISQNYEPFVKAIENIKQLIPDNKIIDSKDVLELIRLFADTWFSLNAFDKDSLVSKGQSRYNSLNELCNFS